MSRVRYACLAALGLLTATGCGDDGPRVTAPTGSYHSPPSATQTAVARRADAPSPAFVDADDALTPSDPQAGATDDRATDALAPETDKTSPDPLADAGTDLGIALEPKMPTLHSHWLSLAQFGERVTVRLNGVWYGEFCGPVLRDITMRLRPGLNVLTVAYTPQRDDAWLAVHVTEGEHTPPIPDLVTYRVAPAQDRGGHGTAGCYTPTTRTFRFTAL